MSDNPSNQSTNRITNFNDLRNNLKEALESGRHMQVEFATILPNEFEQAKKNAAKIKKQKVIKDFTTKKIDGSIKDVFASFMSITVSELRKNPKIVEPKKEEASALLNHMLPLLKFDYGQGVAKLKSFQKDHFFPTELRLKIWKRTIANDSRIHQELFQEYYKVVENLKNRIPNYHYIHRLLSIHTKSSIDQEKVVTSCMNILLTFQMFRSDILFRDGMHKIVVFFYNLFKSEFHTFKQFHNLILSCPMLKGYYKGRYKKMRNQVKIFEKMMSLRKKNKDLTKMYNIHEKLFKKFFFVVTTSQFQDVFDTEIVEKIVDHFVVFGEATLYAIGLFLLEQIVFVYPDIDKHTDVEDLISICRVIENAVTIRKLIYLEDYRAIYEQAVKLVKSESN